MSELEERGFALRAAAFDAESVGALAGAIGATVGPGARGILANPHVAAFSRSPEVMELLRPHFDATPFPVRGLLFNKTASEPWAVPWHQDLTIAVQRRVEVPGFGPWTVKDGVTHVQPPLSLLERMVTLRLHLDDTDEHNGALRVLPGTHRLGRLSPERIAQLAREPDTLCPARVGGVLLMKPLLLHASSKGSAPSRRRVLHLEYACDALPLGLAWTASPPR